MLAEKDWIQMGPVRAGLGSKGEKVGEDDGKTEQRGHFGLGEGEQEAD